MERFMKRHESRIVGSIAGFDRVLFKGNLSTICHLGGMDRFLSSMRVLYKDFMDFAEGMTEAVKTNAHEFAERRGRPIIQIKSPKESKQKRAQSIMEKDKIKEGLVCVMTCTEPCQSFKIRKDALTKHIYLTSAERKCQFLYFYFVDREFGLFHVRLQTWLPLTIQVCINGREWLARQMDKAGIKYKKVDNCFTWIADIEKAQKLMDHLSKKNWSKFLNGLAKKVNPWLNPKGRIVLRPYYWTFRASEYATDIIFRDQQSLDEIYPALIHYAIEGLGTEDILRFLSRATINQFRAEVRSNLQRRGDGIRVRHWAGENSVKMYNKAGNVLRVETTINNPRRFTVHRQVTGRDGKTVFRWTSMRKGIADSSRRVEVSRAANERYLNALAVVGELRPSRKLMDSVSSPVKSKQRRYRALRPISPEDSRLFQIVMKGQHQIQGIRNEDVRNTLFPHSQYDQANRKKASARTGRLLRLLRAHDLIFRVSGTNYYRITKKGHDIMATSIRFRESDIALLAA